ncbi:MAG: alpha/beta fold hydrolase [Thiohalocapsa sp.]|nr:alpha/beta fold hydrolase [Thiohalocapsa sp.]
MIVYLHGLNSSGGSLKARRLREALAPAPVLSPDYRPHRPAAGVAELTAGLRHSCAGGAAPLLVGSSMGGFYGQFLARFLPVRHLFLINPALKPWDLLPAFVDQPMTTAAGEHYRLSAPDIEETRAFGLDTPCDGDDDGVPTTLFLDAGDEVIDYRTAQSMYRACGRVHVYPGGDHAFQHMDEAIDVIRAVLGGREEPPE